tara:strand:- start:247 stop:624 length:378 start_codon:yes stop_codon:yes gene_type:complete
MPLYKQDPNNSKKQIPDIQGDNRHDQISSPTVFTLTKTPSYVIVTDDITSGIGFFFNSSNQFSASAAAEGGGLTTYSGSAGYDEFAHGTLKAGQYNLHPSAVSGSATDAAKIKFVYKSGLATGGF